MTLLYNFLDNIEAIKKIPHVPPSSFTNGPTDVFSCPWLTEVTTARYVKFMKHAAAAAKSLQSCPTLCDPIDGSPLGSAIHGIFQARVLEHVAIAFSACNMSKK